MNFKGKVLGETSTLKQSLVGDGAKIMLMASQGLHQGVSLLLLVIQSLKFCHLNLIEVYNRKDQCLRKLVQGQYRELL